MKRLVRMTIFVVLTASLFLTAPAAAGDKLFFISWDGDKVNWIDWATFKKGTPVKVPLHPVFVVQGADQNIAFVLSKGKHKGSHAQGPGSISILDTSAKKIVSRIEVGWGLEDFYWNPDRSKLFILTGVVGVKPDAKAKTGLYIFNINSRQVEQVLPMNYNPVATALSPDGKLLAVATAGLPAKDASKAVPAALQIYDLVQGSLTAESQLPQNPSQVAFSPDGGKIFILNVGYPNNLDKEYPQIDPGAPVEASVNVWDVAGQAMIGTQKVGQNPKQMLVAPGGSGAYLTAMIEKKPAAVHVNPIDGVRNYTAENPILRLIEDPNGLVLYLVNEKSVDVLDVKTWSKINSIPHQEKKEMLTVGTIPDGRGFVFERDKRRISFYDPASNQLTTVSVGKPANLLLKSTIGNYYKNTVQVVGNKMYLLPYLGTHVAVVDLNTLQMIKEIEITLPNLINLPQDIFPETIEPNPLGQGLLASSKASLGQLSVVPINTDTDQIEKGYKVPIAAIKIQIGFGSNKDVYDPATGRKLNNWDPSSELKDIDVLRAGPFLDVEHKVVYTPISASMLLVHYIDLTTGKGGYINMGSGNWEPQIAEKVEWIGKKKWWFNF